MQRCVVLGAACLVVNADIVYRLSAYAYASITTKHVAGAEHSSQCVTSDCLSCLAATCHS